MRRIADVYPGEAKTDARDADAARTMPHPLRSLELTDEITAELTVLVGFDQDLAVEATRTSNRIPKVCPFCIVWSYRLAQTTQAGTIDEGEIVRGKLIGALVPTILAGAAIIPFTAGTASADPACAEDVYGKKVSSGSQEAYQIDVTLNRCDRKTRAMAKCAGLGGSGINYGPAVIRGTSRTEFCAGRFEMVKYGWQVYYGGQWNNRWVD
ncbi:hypothetical protein SALBM311S_10090 [Streptomyces alboniger]